jgi:crossover junction endodeoxyribonuclease RuvC
MRVLGIDPGSRRTGWGVVDADGWEIAFVAAGAIRLDAEGSELATRLARLAEGLRGVLAAHAPECVAVEQVFSAKNSRSALVLGHARGVALLVAAEAGMPLHEYTPMQVKSAVAGWGRADKRQVQQAVATQLSLRCLPQPLDASDALAVATCHAGAARLEARLGRLRGAGGLT